MVRLDDIYDAIATLDDALSRLRNRGDYDYVRDAEHTVKRAREAYRVLSQEWSRAKEALEASKRSYDAYVTSPSRRGSEE